MKTKTIKAEEAKPTTTAASPEASPTVRANPVQPETPSPEPDTHLPAVINPVSTLGHGVDASLLSDVRIPRLNLVANTGELARQFKPGSYVLNRAILIAEPEQPFEIIVLNISGKRWLKRSSDLTAPPVWADSEAQVRQLGGTTNYQQWKDSNGNLALFRPYVIANLLIKRPAHIEPESEAGASFLFRFGEDNYALATYGITGVAYNIMVRRLLTERFFGILRGGWCSHSWLLNSRNMSFKSIWAWVPQIKPAKAVPREVMRQIESIGVLPVSTLAGESEVEVEAEEAEDNVPV